MYLRTTPQKPKNKLLGVWIALIAAYLAVGSVYFGRETGITPALVRATATPDETLEQRLTRGDKAFQAGNMVGAEDAYQRAVLVAPNSDLALHQYAMILVYRRRYDLAVTTARKAIAADPRSAANYSILAFALDWAGKYDEAIDTGLQALNLDPSYADAYAYLAEAYADKNRTDRALEMGRKAVELNGDSWLAHRNLGYALESIGRYKDAIAEYRRAIDIFPTMAILYMSLSQNLRQTRANAEADD